MSVTASLLEAPFVWFGGKRKVAPQVWSALGDVDNYAEPFAGSLAVLLGRPHDLSTGTRRILTSTSTGGNKDNRHGEVLWCSPACLNPAPRLFEVDSRRKEDVHV